MELDKLNIRELRDLKDLIDKKIREQDFFNRKAILTGLLESGHALAIACPHCKGTGNIEVEHMGSDNMEIDYYTAESCEYCEDGIVYGVSFRYRDEYDEVCKRIIDAEGVIVK